MPFLTPQPAGPAASGRALAVVSVHASPLGDLGVGENGGMNLAIRRTCEGLAELGIPTDVFVRRDDPDLPAEELIAPGSRLVRIPAGPPERLPKHDVLRWLPQFGSAVLAHAASEERRYRLVHTHYWLSGWVGRQLVRRWDVPWVHSFHTLARVKEAAGLPAEPERGEMEGVIARAADRLVVISAAEEAALVEHYSTDRERICVVPLGVDLEEFGPRPSASLRARLGLQNRRVVLYAGRLEPLKGADLLLEAMALLARERDLADVAVLLAGDDSGDGARQSGHAGGERRRLEALASARGLGDRVRFLGAVPHDHLAELYSLADVCAVPSHTESFGLVALEAQASGTPVVASAVGGLLDLVEDGVTGHLVAGRDPARYAARLAALLRDPVRSARMGEAARARAATFTWSRAVDRLVHLYDCVETPEPAGTLEACGCL